MSHSRLRLGAVLGSLFLGSLLSPRLALAQGIPYTDQLAQPPQLDPPSRGSVAGQYASVAFGAGEVNRGTFALPLPITLPSDRGAIGASPIPSYSADAAASEWGAGWWSPNLSIYRSRVLGDVDYATDERTGPWGRMLPGTDGAWYPDGLKTAVRVVEDDTATPSTMTAYLPDGSVWRFSGAVGISTSRGTYSWQLETVVSALGRTTTYNYATNASGRPFLTAVTYGGTDPSTPEYQVAIDYEPMSMPLIDYRSGQKVMLDQRVRTVHVQALDNGVFTERHTWSLGYQQDQYTLSGKAVYTSATFYLSSLAQTFAASGQTAPPVTYVTELAGVYFASAAVQTLPAFTPLLSQANNGLGLPLPGMSTQFDVDLDGRTDLERQFDNALLHQTTAGWETESLPAPSSGTANPMCRKAPAKTNAPRTLARMVSGSDEVHVVGLQAATNGSTTSVALCDRPGSTLWQPRPLAGNWALGPNTRLVDLNRDFAPELIHVSQGRYQVVANLSTPSGFNMVVQPSGTLTPPVNMDTSWVHDLNGDGIPDILARSNGAVWAWLGEGHYEFDPNGIELPVLDATGNTPAELTAYQFVFFDANNDGITDLLLSNGTSVLLFANTGTSFREVTVPVFTSSIWSSVRPVVLDAAGTGNTEITYVQGQTAYAVDLDAPGVGLLQTADDGRGTVLTFGYQRAAADVGVRYRNSLLASLQVASTGYDAVTYEYSFGGPEMHSVGHFLLGYDSVARQGAEETTWMNFLNTDDAPGNVLSAADQDLLEPNVAKVSARTYQLTSLRGVPWMQLESESRGWSSATPGSAQMLETTQYGAYSGICATQTVGTSSAGTLATTKVYDSSLFPNALSCVAEHVTMVGTHPDSTLNFAHEAEIAHNAVGLVTNVTAFEPAAGDASGAPLDLQDVGYDPAWEVRTISSPGKGASTYAFAAGTGLLASVTDPAGVVTAVMSRDPLSDAVLALSVNRGGLFYVRDFTFDGLERLATSWNNLGVASATMPDEIDTYRYATGSLPALTQVSMFATLSSQGAAAGGPPQPTYAQSAYVAAADGQELGLASLIPQGWAFARATARSRVTRTNTGFVSPTVASVAALTVPELYAGAQPVSVAQSSLFGFAAAKDVTYQASVTRDLADTLALDGAGAERTEVENGALATQWSLDEEGRVRRYVDQAGTATSYAYDSFGRLRRVVLPDGTHHAIDYNDYGQVTSIVRDGVATLAYTYDPRSGLLTERDTIAAAGTPTAGTIWRREQYEYDPIGRTYVETDVDVASDASQIFQYYYDGATPADPTAAGALGLLTAVAGSGYTRTMTYRADGTESGRAVTIDGWRTITNEAIFDEDGTPEQVTLTISDNAGNVLATDVSSTIRDAYGRLVGTLRDGSPFASYAYDANGLPLTATFTGPYAHGETATLAYDPATRLRTGLSQSNETWSAAVNQVMGTRGLLASQSIAVSSLSISRQFGYSPQGFLTSSADPHATYTYNYGPDGEPAEIVSTIEGVTDTRAFARNGNVLSAGTHEQAFDDIGRVIQRDGVSLVYGPNGQVADAYSDTSAWSYIYDEKGNRVAKVVGGTPVAAYLPGGAYLAADALTVPLRFQKQLVAVLQASTGASPASKAVALAATDLTGTVQSDVDGTPRLGSPFGDRATRPDLAPALDFAEKSYDADLGIVRMGVRDYDPSVSRFLTPDPLFLEHPGQCVGNPVECALYTYAKNNPSMVVDPTGNAGVMVSLGGGADGGLGFFGFSGNLTASFYVGTEGVKPLLTFQGVSPYATDGHVNPAGTVVGASGGINLGGSLVKDGNALTGIGREQEVATPVFGANMSETSDGKLNSVGGSAGIGTGVSVHDTDTYTLDLKEEAVKAALKALGYGPPPAPGTPAPSGSVPAPAAKAGTPPPSLAPAPAAEPAPDFQESTEMEQVSSPSDPSRQVCAVK